MVVTIKDVAKETNLAISTISKYMNGGNVRSKNKKIIDEAIQKLGYRPNDNARGLRNAKTYTVGVLIDSLGSQYFSKVTQIVEKFLKKEGYSVLVCCHKDDARKAREAIEFLVAKQVDGIIIEALESDEDYTAPLRYHNIPYQATEYLIQQGHKKIAIISGTSIDNTGLLAGKERLTGYLRAMEDYELEVQKEYVVEGNFKFESGYKCMQKLWNLKKRPSAVFISNYNMCLGAMAALNDMKIAIPEELSLVTFDDLEFSVISNPMLTAIKQPMEEIAEKAVELVLRRIDGDYADYPKNLKLPTELVVRDSVAKY